MVAKKKSPRMPAKPRVGSKPVPLPQKPRQELLSPVPGSIDNMPRIAPRKGKSGPAPMPAPRPRNYPNGAKPVPMPEYKPKRVKKNPAKRKMM